MTAETRSPFVPTQPAIRQPGRRRTLSGLRDGMDAFGYLRVSTNEKKQLSIPDQMRMCEAQAQRDGRRIIAWFKDEVSRGVRRQGLVDLMDALETNPTVGAVYFWQASRMWGHVEQQRRILYRHRVAGVRLIDSKGIEWKDDTPLDKLKNLISGGLNEYEVNTVAERVHDTHTEKTKIGVIVQRPPYGVQVSRYLGKDDEGNDVVRSRFEIHPEQIKVVRRVFQEYASGKAAWKIAVELTDEKISTQGGKSWSAVNIRRMLNNRFYLGETIWNRTKTEWEIDPVTGDKIKSVAYRPKEEYVHGKHALGCILADDPSDPRSVAAANELFEMCQGKRAQPDRQRPKRVYENRVLDGLVVCGRCNYRMQARRIGQKYADGERSMKFDYRCQHYANANNGCTKSHSMSEAKIFRLLAEAFDGRGNIHITLKPTRAESNRAGQGEIDKLKGDIRTAERKLERIEDAWEAGAYDTVAEYKERKSKVKAEMDRAKVALANATDEREGEADVLDLPQRQRDLLQDIIEIIQDEKIDLDFRRAKAHEMFRQIVVDNPRITIVPNETAFRR